MKIIKEKIKFSDLPKEQKESEIYFEAFHLKEIFRDEESWKTCTDKEYKRTAKEWLIADEDVEERKYSLIEFKNGKQKWIFSKNIDNEQENERLGIY
jgi:hypothetical protein